MQTKLPVQDNSNPTQDEMSIRHAIHLLQDACDDQVVLMQKNGIYLIPSILGDDKYDDDADEETIEFYAGTIEYQVSDGLPNNRSTSFDSYNLCEAIQQFEEVSKNGFFSQDTGK